MRGRICTTCHHPDRRAIDDRLALGATVREIAAAYGIAKSSVARHRKDCLAPRLVAAARVVAPSPEPRREVERARSIAAGEVAPSVEDILSLTALLERLARSLERLEMAADKSATDEQPMALAALSGQLHRGIETAAKITGVTREQEPVSQFGIQIVIPPAQHPPATVPKPRADGPKGDQVVARPGDKVTLRIPFDGVQT
jgi:hypothetical protein